MKSTSLFVATALSFSTAAVPANAGSLVYVTSDTDGSDYYYDSESMRNVDGNIAVWEIEDASKNNNKKYRSSRVRILYDCKNESYAFMMILKYNASGTPIESFTWEPYERQFRSIVPGTTGATQFDVICRGR